MSTDNLAPAPDARQANAPSCWFCGHPSETVCGCGRNYCDHHGSGICLVCMVAQGVFENNATEDAASGAEHFSGLITLSLRAASNDPYIVIPPQLRRIRPLPLAGVERLVGSLVKMLTIGDDKVVRRAAAVLAATTNSWPTLDPSPLAAHKHGTSLLAADQVRQWLLYTLKQSRDLSREPVALAILDKLRTADFRDLYPGIRDNLRFLRCSTPSTRVNEVFAAIEEFYPTRSHLANERCELLVYEHYVNANRGAGELMKRMYGPLLRYSNTLRAMLKKGTWLSSRARFEDWYYGEDEPE